MYTYDVFIVDVNVNYMYKVEVLTKVLVRFLMQLPTISYKILIIFLL